MGSNSYCLKLSDFEGPLDLLLQLIQKEEADIDKISISMITAQYLEYIVDLPELDLDQASEFVMLAATLLELKARTLLPRPLVSKVDLVLEPEEGKSEILTAEELADRLNVYRRFKEKAEELRQREEIWSKVHTRSIMNEALVEGFSTYLPTRSIPLSTLCSALKKVLEALEVPEPFLEFQRELVTVADQMQYILERVAEAAKPLSFVDLFFRMSSRGEIVTAFLALLELIRCHQVRVVQYQALGPILVEPWVD